MTHCEKCIHYELCKSRMDFAPDDTFSFFPYNEDCKHFKNKADFVEVVRCKDCKHSCFLTICQFTHQEIYECLKGTKELKGVTDYCSCGERKGV